MAGKRKRSELEVLTEALPAKQRKEQEIIRDKERKQNERALVYGHDYDAARRQAIADYKVKQDEDAELKKKEDLELEQALEASRLSDPDACLRHAVEASEQSKRDEDAARSRFGEDVELATENSLRDATSLGASSSGASSSGAMSSGASSSHVYYD